VSAHLTDLLAAARAWAADDPDAVTRDELVGLADAAEGGDEGAATELADAMAGMLEFGTAGLRGKLGGGNNRMNRAVVIRAAAGLTAYLKTLNPEPFVVVGFDARTNSDVFARDTAAVVVAANGRASILNRTMPTPVLAYAIRWLGADAGVMVTASHNPPQDNGYKVYLGDGSQIVSPVDALIAEQIAQVSSVAGVARADDGWETLGDDVWQDYLRDAAAVVEHGAAAELSVVHTALHGVGTETVLAAFERAGFSAPNVVESQAQPDPAFPTVSFPNPEEPGAIDAAIELAEQTGPDVVIANDPDADRCAAAVPGPGGWRMLRGDEVGALLGAHLLAKGSAAGGAARLGGVRVRQLDRLLADARRDVPGGRGTSRGDPDRLQVDLPGARAALRLRGGARLLRRPGAGARQGRRQRRAALRRTDRGPEGRGPQRRRPARRPGPGPRVHATDAFSVRVEDLSLIGEIMARLRATPLTSVAGVDVARADDLAQGDGGLPPTEGLRYYLADESRIIVRPSGTEPKLKVYLEVIEPVGTDEEVKTARGRAGSRLAGIRADLEAATRL
jgi:phosphomannomutase